MSFQDVGLNYLDTRAVERTYIAQSFELRGRRNVDPWSPRYRGYEVEVQAAINDLRATLDVWLTAIAPPGVQWFRAPEITVDRDIVHDCFAVRLSARGYWRDIPASPKQYCIMVELPR